MNELERQKLLEQLGSNQDRSPASYQDANPQLKGPQQGPPSPVYQNESISNEPLNLPADMPQVGRISDEEAASAAQPSKRQAMNMSNVGGDMMVGASHALLGLLSGNFNRAAMEYGKADQYLSGQRAQDIKNLSNLTMTIGPDGIPIYTPKVEAAGEAAYIKPTKPSAGMMPKHVEVVDPKDPSKSIFAAWDPMTSKFKNIDTGEVIQNAQPVVKAVSKTITDSQGNILNVPVNPLTGQPMGTSSTLSTGEAAKQGLGTKQLEQGYKAASTIDQRLAPVRQTKSQINSAMDMLNSQDEQTKHMGIVAAANMLQKASSDKQMQMIAPPGLLDAAYQKAQTVLAGRAAPEEINSLKEMLTVLNKSQDEYANSIMSDVQQGYAGEDEAAKNFLSKRVPQIPSVQTKAQPAPVVQKQVVSAQDHQDASDAIKWANSHPKDPRAKEIFKRFGRQ